MQTTLNLQSTEERLRELASYNLGLAIACEASGEPNVVYRLDLAAYYEKAANRSAKIHR